MLALTPLFATLLACASYVSATALTYKLVPNEKECFYAFVDKKDAKIAFYFAVQSGGSFDGECMSFIPRGLGEMESGDL